MLVAFQNKVLRNIFVPKREKVAGRWEKLHTEAPPDLCSSVHVIIYPWLYTPLLVLDPFSVS
jgi:hypothetical protein